MAIRYLIDFETKSDLDLTVVGLKRYLDTPSSDIICMSWRTWDSPVQLWVPGMPIPFYPESDDKVYAHNISFDFDVWHTLGLKYYFPKFNLSQCVDVMALCARYTYPMKLEQVGKVLNLQVQKNPVGKKLMKRIGQPPFKYTQEELHEFYRYCIDDTESMFELINSLPTIELEESEQKIWETTYKINHFGLPIDTPTVDRIYEVVEYHRGKRAKIVEDITDGEIKTVGQVAAIKSWAKERDVFLPDLQVQTVDRFLQEDIHPDVKALLKLRKELALSSTAKYKRLKEKTYYARLYNNLDYYRASTGRWGGRDFQLHNLPRAKVKDVPKTISAFYDTSILRSNPVYCAKALIRSMIKGPKDKLICACDYSAIENVVLLWMSGQEDQLEKIRQGLDHYKVFASNVYNITYDQVDSEQRFLGKTGVLGAGYQSWAHAFLNFAQGYGLDLSYEMGEFIIKTYRSTHNMVVKFWENSMAAAVRTVASGTPTEYRSIRFCLREDRTGVTWLCVRIPSGRWLFYHSPEVAEGLYGSQIIKHMGIDPYTKQWVKRKLIPGRLTENIDQAISRDIMAHAKIRLLEEGEKVIGSVHDEIICEVPEGNTSYPQKIINIMQQMPDWCKDLPLKASGFAERRYRK